MKKKKGYVDKVTALSQVVRIRPIYFYCLAHFVYNIIGLSKKNEYYNCIKNNIIGLSKKKNIIIVLRIFSKHYIGLV